MWNLLQVEGGSGDGVILRGGAVGGSIEKRLSQTSDTYAEIGQASISFIFFFYLHKNDKMCWKKLKCRKGNAAKCVMVLLLSSSSGSIVLGDSLVWPKFIVVSDFRNIDFNLALCILNLWEKYNCPFLGSCFAITFMLFWIIFISLFIHFICVLYVISHLSCNVCPTVSFEKYI